MLCTRNPHNVVGQLFVVGFKNKKTNSQKKRTDLWLPEAGVLGRRNWMQAIFWLKGKKVLGI